VGRLCACLTLITEVAPERVYPLREILNALRYMVKTGEVWRMMPHGLPPWEMVFQQTCRRIRRLQVRLLSDAPIK
jgi:transposase